MPFLSVDHARDHAKKRGDWLRAAKQEARAAKKYSDAEIAARLRGAGALPVEGDLPEAAVHQLVVPHRAAPRRAGAVRADAAQEAGLEARLVRLDAHRAEPAADEDAEQRFARARALESAQAAGEALTEAQAAWLAEYQHSSEYRAQARVARWSGADS